MAATDPTATEDLNADEGRRAVTYLVVAESRQYLAIMELLESSIGDLRPDEVLAGLRSRGEVADQATIQARLDKLREWGVVSARTDASRIRRHADLLARNWRYTATTVGRQVQRFYRTYLAGTTVVREIPLLSLARFLEHVEELASPTAVTRSTADVIGQVFVNHDDLDASLVGAEDGFAALIDRFDLDDQSMAELKSLLVGYATHTAVELDRGSLRAHRALSQLRGRFSDLAVERVRASEARALIERGALSASRGGRREDWEGLLAWFDPTTGRAARFGFRLVRALPGMHVNLRRLHSSLGSATARSRALALARACLDREHGPAIFRAAVGDHPWRKLHGEAEEAEGGGLESWRGGALVDVPPLLRATGRAGARGRPPAVRDDAAARAQVFAERERRSREIADAVREILAARPGARLSERAARIALRALLRAVRSTLTADRRVASEEGLCCTIFQAPNRAGALHAPSWSLRTPGRVFVFHSNPAAAPDPPPVSAADVSGAPRTDRTAP